MKLSIAAFLLATPAQAGLLDMFRGNRKLASAVVDKDSARGHRRLQSTQDDSLVDITRADPTQTFYIPLPETEVFYEALRVIQPGSNKSGDRLVDGKMFSLISVAISTDKTVIWYDHWEDNYETDVTKPVSTNTAIWGDGDASNGCRPDISLVKTCTDEDDYLNAGDSFVMESKVTVPRTKGTWQGSDGLKFDGGDKLMSSYPVTITRGEYAEKPGSLLAGAVEVYDTKAWGTEFQAPVGTDFDVSTGAFEYVKLFLMSGTNNNEITLPDGEVLTLDDGASSSVTVEVGDKITSMYPIQVYLVTGDKGSTYEMRWFSMLPCSLWSDSYLAPVGDDFARTKVLMYNPGDRSITVEFTYLNSDGSEVSENVSLPSKSAKYSRIVPTGSGAFVESTGNNFYALSVTDTEMDVDKNGGGTERVYGQAFDWGHPLQPANQLTSQVLVGWGYGCTNNDCQGKTERSAVWVSAMADADFYIDYQNVGSGYDVYPVSKYQSIMIRDTNDHDMSGAIIFATAKDSGVDGSPVDFASAWGQDPSVSRDMQAISLDLGTAVLPFPVIRSRKEVNKEIASPGDVLTYSIYVSNVGQISLQPGQYSVVDPLPAMTTFVEGSLRCSLDGGSTFTDVDVSSFDLGSTPYPLDESGMPSSTVLSRRGGTHVYSFQVLIDPDIVDGDVLENVGYTSTDFFGDVSFDATTKLVFGPDISVSNTVYIGDKGDVGCDSAGDSVTDVTDTQVTYCFAVTNIGSTYLDAVTLTNSNLGIVSGDLPIAKLAPGESELVTFKSTISEDLVNTVKVEANPVYNNGNDIDGVPDVGANDQSEVVEIDQTPDINIDNTVYSGQFGADACASTGVEVVRGLEDTPVTYCFNVTNTGNTHLTNVKVTDQQLGYTNDAIVDLAPGASTIVSMTSTITVTLENAATATGTPSSPQGQPIAGLDDVSNTDPSQVFMVIDSDTRSGDKPERPPTCMQTNWEDAGNSQDLVCRAKEVYFLDWIDPPSLTCTEGETIKLSLLAKIHYNTARFDSGWYVAADGGDALQGTCAVNGLVSGAYNYQPQATKAGTDASIVWNQDAKGGNDECGDLIIAGGGGADLVVPFIEEQEIKCVDDNLDGLLDFGVCFSWRVEGTDGFCTLSRDADGTQGIEADLFPGMLSKCFCSRIDVPSISVVKPNDKLAVSPC